MYLFVQQTFTKCLPCAWQRAMNTVGTLQLPGKMLGLEDKENLGVPGCQKGDKVASPQPRAMGTENHLSCLQQGETHQRHLTWICKDTQTHCGKET